MDLGIAGRTAIVCGASKGLGKGCAMALAREGVNLVLNARDVAALDRAAEEIHDATGVNVVPAPADITTDDGRAAVLEVCPDPDILITNSGGPPAGDFRDWDQKDWHKALQSNMVTHILMIQSVIDGMVQRRFGRVVNVTSASVKMPYAGLDLSSGARAGLTGALVSLAREVVRHGVTINNLLPGSHETDRLTSLIAKGGAGRGLSAEAALAEARAGETAGRFGTPEEFGAICAFLCGAHTGFMTGQNLLIDGGAYPGTL
jgi:3-oxoacyl-[acyl-carrier protein] reductase